MKDKCAACVGTGWSASDSRWSKTGPREGTKQLIAYIKANPGKTAPEMAAELGCTQVVVRNTARNYGLHLKPARQSRLLKFCTSDNLDVHNRWYSRRDARARPPVHAIGAKAYMGDKLIGEWFHR